MVCGVGLKQSEVTLRSRRQVSRAREKCLELMIDNVCEPQHHRRCRSEDRAMLVRADRHQSWSRRPGDGWGRGLWEDRGPG